MDETPAAEGLTQIIPKAGSAQVPVPKSPQKSVVPNVFTPSPVKQSAEKRVRSVSMSEVSV